MQFYVFLVNNTYLYKMFFFFDREMTPLELKEERADLRDVEGVELGFCPKVGQSP